ncbi:KaiC domain-containing protein [Halovenus salina]|uniref:KaiC domain-containing protein n=1 Tax=Halovenus salina TaxID=1510225 RepID=UPI002260836F|nr:KaiC domain-containing protein [Halovenus salina]
MSEDGTSEDEDWFEQGLRDSEDSTEGDDRESSDDDPESIEAEAGSTDAAATEAESSAGWTQSVDADDDSESFADEFGTDDGASGAFGGAETDDSDDGLFDEGFGDAFGGASDDGDFAEGDFESEIPRLDLGIEGLDQMIQGGVPKKHLLVVIGSAGTGKTTFGLQFLNHGLRNGENAVFITLEQSREAIIATANEWGWDFEQYERDGQLAVVDLDPVEMANSLDNIQAELPELIRDFGADRLVLDSVSLLEMMYNDQAKRRTEVFDFTRALKKAGVTTFLTSEASESNAYASRHGIIEYLTDAVFILQYVRGETQETRLAVEIQKIRNANHSREQKPYEMTDEGISVYQQANIF